MKYPFFVLTLACSAAAAIERIPPGDFSSASRPTVVATAFGNIETVWTGIITPSALADLPEYQDLVNSREARRSLSNPVAWLRLTAPIAFVFGPNPTDFGRSDEESLQVKVRRAEPEVRAAVRDAYAAYARRPLNLRDADQESLENEEALGNDLAAWEHFLQAKDAVPGEGELLNDVYRRRIQISDRLNQLRDFDAAEIMRQLQASRTSLAQIEKMKRALDEHAEQLSAFSVDMPDVLKLILVANSASAKRISGSSSINPAATLITQARGYRRLERLVYHSALDHRRPSFDTMNSVAHFAAQSPFPEVRAEVVGLLDRELKLFRYAGDTVEIFSARQRLKNSVPDGIEIPRAPIKIVAHLESIPRENARIAAALVVSAAASIYSYNADFGPGVGFFGPILSIVQSIVGEIFCAVAVLFLILIGLHQPYLFRKPWYAAIRKKARSNSRKQSQ